MTGWTLEQDAMLRDNCDKGLPRSYAEMAADINARFGTDFTRNAAIGRGHRLGLTNLRPKGAKTGPKLKKAITPPQRPDIAIRKAASEPKPAPFVPRVVVLNSENVPLLELAPDGCKWPTAESTVHLFCNHRRLTSLPYCAPHQRIARRA